MTTYYAPRNAENPYGIVSNAVTRNPNLSSIAYRILAVVLGKPQGWQPNVENLMTEMPEG